MGSESMNQWGQTPLIRIRRDIDESIGNQSSLTPLIILRGRALGTVFYMRDDLSVCTVMISGIPMETDGLWEQLLLPRLEMLSRSAS
jgi:hypothetical protein